MKFCTTHGKNKKELHPLYVYLKETEKKRKKEYEQFVEHVSRKFSVPGDILAGQAVITLIGNHGIRVENYRTIEVYSTESIQLSLGKKNLFITGSQLMIDYFRKDEIKIVGNIDTVSFQR